MCQNGALRHISQNARKVDCSLEKQRKPVPPSLPNPHRVAPRLCLEESLEVRQDSPEGQLITLGRGNANPERRKPPTQPRNLPCTLRTEIEGLRVQPSLLFAGAECWKLSSYEWTRGLTDAAGPLRGCYETLRSVASDTGPSDASSVARRKSDSLSFGGVHLQSLPQ
jgi:hypothetical protein